MFCPKTVALRQAQGKALKPKIISLKRTLVRAKRGLPRLATQKAQKFSEAQNCALVEALFNFGQNKPIGRFCQ